LVQLAELEPQLALALDRRNQFVHASWALGPDYMLRTRLPRGGRVRGEILRLTVPDVEAAIEKIGAATEAVEGLYDALLEVTPKDDLHPRGGPILADGTYVPGMLKK